jgi:tetrapyrrole methylase family protein/MazG family protein
MAEVSDFFRSPFNQPEVPIKMKKKRKKVAPRPLRRREFEKKRKSVLEGVPEDSPSLSQAYQLTQKASRVGFDWADIEGVLKKLDEEIGELREALSLQNRKRIREEIGDLLFVLANVSRFLRINPEEALKETLDKFVSRFHYIERALHGKGKSFPQSNLLEMDRLWEESKRKKLRN